MPVALITGVSGQDGSYLAELLTARGYRVAGTTRDAAAVGRLAWSAAYRGVDLLEGDVASRDFARWALREVSPDEVYHLAAPSRVSTSWDNPAAAIDGIVAPTEVLLKAVVDVVPRARFVAAGSCEMFAPEEKAQDETAPRGPVSPYGRAKAEAWELVRHFRDTRGLFAVTAILFNHESPRRGESFVTRKITGAAARLARERAGELRLGSLDVRRDWGFAGDYVLALWRMLAQREPEDLVIGTGSSHSIADFCEAAFGAVGLDWQEYVVSDPALFRPADPPLRLANPDRARRRLEWSHEVDFPRLVTLMVEAEIEGRRPAD